MRDKKAGIEIDEKEKNVYSKEARARLLRQGEIDAEEDGFMRGYEGARER